jgi:hypothetical protein
MRWFCFLKGISWVSGRSMGGRFRLGSAGNQQSDLCRHRGTHRVQAKRTAGIFDSEQIFTSSLELPTEFSERA